MSNFKVIQTGGRAQSINGEIRVLADDGGLFRKVELWLLNDVTNRNNWRYERLEEHKKLFAFTPILVAYVGGEIGDGHNSDSIINADGSVTESYMSATAERIVGFFKTDDELRTVEKDGKQWIVGTGYIWRWYAQELVAKLERQGKLGMSVSIETLIDEMHYEGKTEVFTKYRILGTTILGDDVAPAVQDANIKVLSCLGADEVIKITKRVASMQSNPQKKSEKGAVNMKLKDVQAKLKDFVVLSLKGNNALLMSASGNFSTCSVEKDNDDIIIGAKTEVCGNATFGEGDTAISVSVDSIVEKLNSNIAELASNLETEKNAREAAETALLAMQKAESARRKQSVKDALKAHFEELKNSAKADLSDDVLNALMTDERINEFSEMEKDNSFVGDVNAKKELDSICMTKILESAKNSKNTNFAWEYGRQADNSEASDLEKAIENINR